MKPGTAIHRNRLAQEMSPYLLQHAGNPVDWYPWGEDAFERAMKEDKPILLSIGYSACHWCHVMERESFSNPDTAAIMNRHFVNVKVDREERPDVDEVYMSAVQLMTGGGGWPLTVFLTPEGKPFFGGTYFPPEDRYGVLGFPRLLEKVAETYHRERGAIEHDSAAVMTALLRQSPVMTAGSHGGMRVEAPMLDRTVARLMESFDGEHGGFGAAPKFPQAGALLLLLEDIGHANSRRAFDAACFTLRAMADGGIYDHLGGGFHRYSTDRYWRVPHFEKMLYDNALLARVYTEAWRKAGDRTFVVTARGTLDFMLSDMRDPSGGFYATVDADSNGMEGAYYVWTLSEIEDALGEEAARHFAAAYGVTHRGNFENGRNVLHVARVLDELAATEGIRLPELRSELARSRRDLLETRRRRAYPHIDKKIITAWNGMAISALARAGHVLKEEQYIKAARNAADFILGHPYLPSGESRPSLAHAIVEGETGGTAFLDDYAWFVEGLLDLYQGTFDLEYLLQAERLGREMLELFAGVRGDGLFYAAATHSPGGRLPIRPRKLLDGSVPCPVAVAWSGLLRLAALTGNPVFAEAADGQERALASIVNHMPEGVGYACYVASRELESHFQIVVVGARHDLATRGFLETIREYAVLPTQTLLVEPGAAGDRLREISAPARGKTMLDGAPTVYMCRGNTCLPPITEAGRLRGLLHNADRGG